MFPKKIKLGKKITTKDLNKAGFEVGTYASQILEKVTFRKQEVELKVISVKELGFTQYTRYDAICAKIKDLGYELCPAEVGPALRMAYNDQPEAEWLGVAMEPIADLGRGLDIFSVLRDNDGRGLVSSYGSPGTLYFPVDGFVVVMPRKYGNLDTGNSALADRVSNLEQEIEKIKKVLNY